MVPRRNLIRAGIAGIGFMALPAEANTPFTGYPFAATGAPTRRTMPDRLAEIKNVLNFGADPTGSADSTSAIQSAMNWTNGPNRGIIFFPPGFYKVTSPLTLPYDPAPGQQGLNIHLLGSETGSVFLNFTGLSSLYGIDRSLVTPNNTARIIVEKMKLNAGIRVGSCIGATIRDVECNYITTEDSPGNSSRNVAIRNCQINSGGLVMGGGGIIEGTDWISCDVAARMYGSGWAIYGCRIEECNTAYVLGLDGGVAATFTGTIAHSGTNDGSGVLTVSSLTSGTIKPWQQLSDGGINIGPGIFITSQTGGTTGGAGTYSLTNPTFTVSSPQTINAIGNDRGASGFTLHGGSSEGNWNGTIYGGTCSGFYHGSMGFLGHSNSGPLNNLPTQYHLVVGPKCSSGKFQGLFGVGDLADVAGGRVDTAATRANLLFQTCNLSKGSSGAPGAVDWMLPSNAYTAQWLASNISPEWTFSQLPAGGNVLQGDQFNISDANSLAWGANVTGSTPGNHALVRWNGSNWTVVGK